MLFTHAFLQVAEVCQLPLVSHASLTLPLQRALPGSHTPRQAPLLQTYWHSAALAHWPFVPHVCGTLPLHWVAPSLQTPHTPSLTQTTGHFVSS
jgi:hypothetical protein